VRVDFARSRTRRPPAPNISKQARYHDPRSFIVVLTAHAQDTLLPDVLGARVPWLGDLPSVRVASLPGTAPSTDDNPLLVANGLPVWDAIHSRHVGPAVRQVIREETASLELLEADLAAALSMPGSGALTFSRIFRPLTQIRLRYDSVSSQISHLTVRTWE
jgi:hypothetical protein